MIRKYSSAFAAITLAFVITAALFAGNIYASHAKQAGSPEETSSIGADSATEVLDAVYHNIFASAASGLPLVTMRNPAAVYCADLGYQHRIITHPDGSQSGTCTLSDNTVCDDWDFLEGKCGTAYNACARNGYQTIVQADGKDPFSYEYAVCTESSGRKIGTAAEQVNLMEKAGGIESNLSGIQPSSVSQTQEEPQVKAPAAPQDNPSSFDWRSYQGADWTSPVKNQGICGSCWAFSAVGTTEAAINIATHNPNLNPDLSEEYLVANCFTGGACDGGWHTSALDYIRDSGTPDEPCLPYLDGRSSGCSYNNGCDINKCTYHSGGECSDYRCSDRCADWSSRLYYLNSVTYYGAISKDDIKTLLVNSGPLSVAMHWGGYFDGNYVYHCDSTSVNHAVVIVGYNDNGGYWIVRNSWGSGWNGNGYFKVAYDNCGIQNYITAAKSCNITNENDNTTGTATTINYGGSSSAGICGVGDKDYYKFNGTSGEYVVIDMDIPNDSNLDTYIELIDSDGTTVLSENDNQPGTNDSRLSYHLTHNGTYYIKVRDAQNGGGDHFDYTINLLLDTVPPAIDITSPAENSWLDTATQVITTTASDNESGVQHVAFYWHDASHTDWTLLGDDTDGSDGWGWNFDTHNIPEQQGIALQAVAYDWAGNDASDQVENLQLDHTIPTVTLTLTPPANGAPFRYMHLDWSDNNDDLSGIQNFDIQVRDGAGGAWEDWLAGTKETASVFVGEDGHTYYFRTRARDNANNVSAYSEGDGDAYHTVSYCNINPDPYESDASTGEAKGISVIGYHETHNTHTAGDADWLKFYATQGYTYTITTADTNNSGYADTILYLYASDASTLLTSNDNYPGLGSMSRIEWTPSVSGFYYLKVQHADPWADGCTTTYDIWIETDQTAHISYLPMIQR